MTCPIWCFHDWQDIEDFGLYCPRCKGTWGPDTEEPKVQIGFIDAKILFGN